MLHVIALFGVNIGVSVEMEVLMNLNVTMTSLVAGVALLRRSGDGSEIRRGKAWKFSSRNPRVRATEGSIPSLRITLMKELANHQVEATKNQRRFLYLHPVMLALIFRIEKNAKCSLGEISD